MVGDKSDNISGVKSVGEKTAITLINEFGSLENILENIEKSSVSPRIKNAIINGKKIAILSYSLAEIKKDVDISYELKLFMTDIKMTSLHDKLLNFSLTKVISKIGFENENREDIEIIKILFDEFKKITDKKDMPYEVGFTLADNNMYVCFKNERRYIQ